MTLINTTTGREAYTGPLGEPGSASPFPGATQWQNPVNGQTTYYVAGSTPDPGNIAALAAAGYIPAAAVGTYEGYPENPGGGAAVGFPGSAPLGSGPQGPGTVQGGGGGTQSQPDQAAQQAQQYQQKSALADLEATLQIYGLQSLAGFITAEITNNIPESQVALDLMQTPEFKTRFPAIQQRQAAGLPAISPTEYIALENGYMQTGLAAGLDPNFIKSVKDNLIGQDVSLNEFNTRIANAYTHVVDSPDDVRSAFGSMYGATGDAALAQYFLNPKITSDQLLKQTAAADVHAAGARFGFGTSTGTAEQIAAQGVTFTDALDRFSKLGTEGDLFKASVGDQTALTPGQGVNAEFGLSGADQQSLIEEEQQRLADFRGGGGRSPDGAATNQMGLVGLAAAGQTIG